jgi:hypothetical protein
MRGAQAPTEMLKIAHLRGKFLAERIASIQRAVNTFETEESKFFRATSRYVFVAFAAVKRRFAPAQIFSPDNFKTVLKKTQRRINGRQ